MLYIVDQTAGKLGKGEDLKSVIPWLVLEKSLLHFPSCSCLVSSPIEAAPGGLVPGFLSPVVAIQDCCGHIILLELSLSVWIKLRLIGEIHFHLHGTSLG
ncbi:hypothetical protein L3X38_029900 [Prunus dulcis]|uniref:Uncharacterized protein n=1 Tax=Prunus dulcis TaxID=3755 RepID=A0AAD4Z1T5_PRUDU|nr:hypothetical protein L3X38_029900 [Prunus dulcis]